MSFDAGPAIAVHGVSKRYYIAHRARPTTLAERVVQAARHPFARDDREALWALKDCSFDVARGDLIGIIGRNGAGKSTLLKLLSRITEPTAGEILMYGRIGALLEVGTGFHPELTGRENVYLNGTILGMRRREIAARFDEIVAFAEVERFLDTPVKHYSSGMYVRLAFAVAAHLEPEVLIVDEVLAVGDGEFQRKCLGKMEQVAHAGRTVLFVSHNMQAISTLTKRTLVLDRGACVFDGATADGIAHYRAMQAAHADSPASYSAAPGTSGKSRGRRAGRDLRRRKRPPVRRTNPVRVLARGTAGAERADVLLQEAGGRRRSQCMPALGCFDREDALSARSGPLPPHLRRGPVISRLQGEPHHSDVALRPHHVRGDRKPFATLPLRRHDGRRRAAGLGLGRRHARLPRGSYVDAHARRIERRGAARGLPPPEAGRCVRRSGEQRLVASSPRRRARSARDSHPRS